MDGSTFDSFRYCQRVTAQARSSFPLAFRVLSPAKRRAMEAVYAFMRLTDDLADEPGETEVKSGLLQQWSAALSAALGGVPTHPVHPALAATVARYSIDPRHLFAVIEGVQTDLEPVSFATFADLYPYCYRVASAVGLACVPIWGLKPGVTFAAAEPASEAAGIAFQLTNILRDLGEDRTNGRVYLPCDELTQFDSPPQSWSPSPEFCEMMRFQVARAHDYFRQARALSPLLSAEGRAIYHVMSGTYRALLCEVEKRPADVLSQRVRVPRWRKAALLASAWPVKWGWC